MNEASDKQTDTNLAGGQLLAGGHTPRRRLRLHPLLAVLLLVVLLNVLAPLINSQNPVLLVALWGMAIVAVLVFGLRGVRSTDRSGAGGSGFARRVSASDKAVRIERSTPPPAFRRRLAAFLGRPESEVLVPRPRPASTMSFWSLVPLPQSATWIKSVAFMRRILERIRSAVRGDMPPTVRR